MDGRATAILLFCSVLLPSSNQTPEGAIDPWVAVKDVLITFPGSSSSPPLTFLQFSPPGIGRGRRLPAVFLVKTPKEEEVVVYLTGIYGEVGEDLLDTIVAGDKIVREYLPVASRSYAQTSHPEKQQQEASKETETSGLPVPFHDLRLSRIVLPSPFFTLSDLARFPASRFKTPSKAVPLFLVAERTEVFP